MPTLKSKKIKFINIVCHKCGLVRCFTQTAQSKIFERLHNRSCKGDPEKIDQEAVKSIAKNNFTKIVKSNCYKDSQLIRD